MQQHGRTGRPTGRPPSARAKALPNSGLDSNENTEIPAAPEHLGEDGQQMWNHVFALKHVSPSDYFAVKDACEIYEEHEYLRRLFSTGQAKRIVTHPNRVRGESPELKDLRMARIELRGALSALGLTPADRARLQVTEDAASLALQALYNEKNRSREERRS